MSGRPSSWITGILALLAASCRADILDGGSARPLAGPSAEAEPGYSNDPGGLPTPCSLERLGAGPLASPRGPSGTRISPPSIASTPGGFVIAYREVDPNADRARLILQPIDLGGGALAPARPLLDGYCPTSNATDGVGLAMHEFDGQVLLARAGCSGKAALDFLSFTSAPEMVVDPSFLSTETASATTLTISGGNVIATRPGGRAAVFVEAGVPKIAAVEPGIGIGGPAGTFGGTANMTGAWAAASDGVLALLAAGPSPTDGAPTLNLVLAPADTPPSDFSATENKPRAPITFTALWGSVATVRTRAVVMSSGGGDGLSAAVRTFDRLDPSTAPGMGLVIEGTEGVTAGDVAVTGNRAYFATLRPGSVAVHVYDNGSDSPTPLRRVALDEELLTPAVARVRDGGVSIAATGTHVAVAWTTTKILGPDDHTGGYAVFACAP